MVLCICLAITASESSWLPHFAPRVDASALHEAIRVGWRPSPRSVTQPQMGSIAGQVLLQGRSDHSGARIIVNGSEVGTTNADGRFLFDVPAGTYTLGASMPGYLRAEAARVLVPPDQTTQLTAITLEAGDINNDGRIDLLDLSGIGSLLSTIRPTEPRTDLNGDGVVDIRDLVLAAQNYDHTAPLVWTVYGPGPIQHGPGRESLTPEQAKREAERQIDGLTEAEKERLRGDNWPWRWYYPYRYPYYFFARGQRLSVVYQGLDGVQLRRTPGDVGKPPSDVLQALYFGAELNVLGGPEEKDDLLWWQVQDSRGNIGWVAATARDGTKLVEATMKIGGTARVVYSQNVNLRRSPGYLGKRPFDVIVELKPGATLWIIDGPVVQDGLRWWRVLDVDKHDGWVAEFAESGARLVAPSWWW